MTGPYILQAAIRKRQRWKNGCGWTSNVITVPPSSDLSDFGWRLSIAEVEAEGPFSIFHGVRRHMLVLAGSLRLQGDGLDRTLAPGAPPFSFSGERPLFGSPIDEPVRDLNLMVQVGRFEGQFEVVEPGTWRSGSGSSVIIGPKALSVVIDAATFELEPEDALLLPTPADVTSAVPIIVAQVRDVS